MKPDVLSVDYQINLETLREMEDLVPMTLHERNAIRKWVHSGHDPESNPWGYFDADGESVNFIEAFRLEFGYAEGPWDFWKGRDISFPAEISKLIGTEFVSLDEL